MKYFFYCLLMFSISLSAYSQKKRIGYFILSNGDTLKGNIRLPLINPDTDYMLYSDSGFVKNFKKSEIIGYGYIKNNTQEDFIKLKLARTIFGKAIYDFAKNIVRGEISLFEYAWDNGKNSGTELYFVTTTGEISVLEFPSLANKKNILKEVLAGCPQAVENIKGIIDIDKVIKLVRMYNSCTVNTN